MFTESTFRSYRALTQSSVIPLHQMLPLKVPYAVHIDPASVCNFKCHFCPTGDPQLLESVGRLKGVMDYGLFKKIIEDLKQLVLDADQQIARLYLYKDGEPLLNKDLAAMVAYTKQAGVAQSIETTTNASLLTESKASELLQAGLDVIRISVEHVSNQGYQEITQTFSNYDLIKAHVGKLYALKQQMDHPLIVYAKILDVNLSDVEKERFLNDFGPISDFVNIDSLTGLSRTDIRDFRLGNTISTDIDSVHPRKDDRVVCPDAFTKLAINFDGTVSVCCQDWSFGTLVGDVRTQSVSEVWQGAELQSFRLMHLKGERQQHPVCGTCDHVCGFPAHTDLDDHRQDLWTTYSI